MADSVDVSEEKMYEASLEEMRRLIPKILEASAAVREIERWRHRALAEQAIGVNVADQRRSGLLAERNAASRALSCELELRAWCHANRKAEE